MSKKKNATASKADALRKMRENNLKKSQQSKPAEKSKAVKPKPPTSLAPSADQKQATQLIEEIKQGVKETAEAIVGAALLDKKLLQAQKEESWKFCATPYKSWSAFVGELGKIAGASKAKLFAIIGLQKALPGATSEERAAIGPRKGAKIAKAAKVAAKKGEVIPPEIINDAAKMSEREVADKLRDAGLEEEKTPAEDKRTAFEFGSADPLMCETQRGNTEQSETIYNPRKGGSGVVAGKNGTAQQLNSVVTEAIKAAQTLYFTSDGEVDVEEDYMTDHEALEFVCRMWLLSICDREGHEDQTNRQAFDEISKSKKASARA